ncbi:MAG TPA: carboxypeptidase regulatory-like domain-containing protein [Gemmatimonadales bacterium]
MPIRSPLVRTALLAIALMLPASPAASQVGSTTDILTGIVRDSAGRPVSEAVVEAISLETQVSRATRTDARGRWVIVFPDGGGQYRLVVRFIGMVPVERLVARQADEDRLVADVTLARTTQRLQDIVVRGRPGPVVAPNAPTPGSIERVVTSEQAARLPLDAGDLNALALLAPGVVAVDATDSTGAGFSVAGQRPGANNTTLDGMSFGASTVPQDGLRATRIITNTYDAARGQFSGGQIASITRSGTNQLAGSENYSLRDQFLELDGEDPEVYARGLTLHQLSGGLGVP